MIVYNVEKFQLKDYILSRFLFVSRDKVIIMSFCFPLIIFFLSVGYLDDAEALLYGYPLLFIFIFLFVVSLGTLVTLKKNTFKHFNEINKNNSIEYNFIYDGKSFTLICVNTGESISFIKNEIKRIKAYKRIIVLELVNKRIVSLPNKDIIYKKIC